MNWESLKFWILEPLLWTLALIGALCLAGIGDAEAQPTAQQMKVHAAQVEMQRGLPSGLLTAVCEQESNWKNVSGRHGEIGVCQVQPDTVRMLCDCTDGGLGVYYQGATGAPVRQLQAELARYGFYTGGIDGLFGPKTAAAVRTFQGAKKLVPDGVVGPKTWLALFAGSEPYPGGTIATALWDPYQNIEWAATYLVWLRENVSAEPAVMLAAYNGGHANPVVRYVVQVQRRMARVGM